MTLAIQSEVGSKIQEKYQNGSAYTPIEQNRNIAAFVAVMGGVLEVTCFSAAVTATSAAASAGILLGAPLLIGGIVAATYYGLIATDYDNPTQRAALVNQLTKQNLTEIASQHSLEKVVGYDLLGMSPYGYNTYSELATNYYQATRERNQTINVINLDYNRNLAPFSNQLYHARQQADLHRNERQRIEDRREDNKQTQNNWQWGFELMEKGVDLYNEVEAQSQYNRAVQVYTEIKNDKIASENVRYRSHCQYLNNTFRNA